MRTAAEGIGEQLVSAQGPLLALQRHIRLRVHQPRSQHRHETHAIQVHHLIGVDHRHVLRFVAARSITLFPRYVRPHQTNRARTATHPLGTYRGGNAWARNWNRSTGFLLNSCSNRSTPVYTPRDPGSSFERECPATHPRLCLGRTSLKKRT